MKNKMKKYLALGLLIALLGLSPGLGLAQTKPAKVLPEKIAKSTASTSSQDNGRVRLIVPRTSVVDKFLFRLKGCDIRHELIDATAVECPNETEIAGARPDRIFYLHDLQADVQIKADKAWNLGYQGSGVKVAILDTGVDATHIELSNSVVATKNFVAGTKFDMDGHGTHVSGIVTANGVYQIDSNYATGVSPGAAIIVGKVCGTTGCYESDVMAGIEWTVAQNADILNLSLGGGNFKGHCDSDPLAAKVNWAVSQGVVAVVSSGNEGLGVSSPACASGAIAVGAVDNSDNRADWSNYGQALDLVAPGVDILSTYSCNAAGNCRYYWYAYMSGTSMAAPHVAGVAALILQKHPGYTVDQVKNALYNTAVDLGTPGWDEYHGYGRVNALAIIDGLVGNWSFEHSNSSGIYDSSLYNNFGEFQGGLSGSSIVNGKIGKALQFDGIDDILVAPDSANLSPTNGVTTMAWVKTADNTKIKTFISKWDEHYSQRSYLIQVDVASVGWYLSENGEWGHNFVTNHDIFGSKNISVGEWHHIAGTFDGNVARIYVDGVLDTEVDVLFSNIFDSNIPLGIGGKYKIVQEPALEINCGEGPQEHFNGTLDEVRIYSRALSQQEIQALMD